MSARLYYTHRSPNRTLDDLLSMRIRLQHRHDSCATPLPSRTGHPAG